MALALCALAFAVMLATDDSQSSLASKTGRLLALGPVLSAISALLINTQSELRGETRALASIGTSPWRSVLWSSIAVLLVGVVCAIGLVLHLGDIEGLLPRIDGMVLMQDSEGGWASPDRAVRISLDGDLSLRSAEAAQLPHRTLFPVVAWVVFTSVVMAAWTMERIRGWSRLLAVASSGATALVVLHAIAAELMSAWTLLVVPLPLICQTWICRAGHRRV